MKLNQIDSVFAVAKHLNFTNAAKSLNISQPALSKQISLLEDNLGVNLFTRDKRSVELTPAGEIFLKEFDLINNQISKSVIKIRQSGQVPSTNLEIGYPHAISCNSFLPALLKSFSEKYPEYNINLSRFNLPDLHRKLLNDELNIIFSFSFELKNLHPVEFKVIETRIPSLIMSASNPISQKGSISFQELKMRLLLY